jgi:hypothetical protein
MRLGSSSSWNGHARRWQIELFFKWIKQHLRISPSGNSPNAVSIRYDGHLAYVLVAIIKKLQSAASLHAILQI